MAGYSKRELKDKLGIKDEYEFLILNYPDNYLESIKKSEKDLATQNSNLDFIQLFTTSYAEFSKEFNILKKKLKPNGMLWISWPKKTSKMPTDLDENKIRDYGLTYGMVDIKVCAVDDNWSGLKFVYRLQDR